MLFVLFLWTLFCSAVTNDCDCELSGTIGSLSTCNTVRIRKIFLPPYNGLKVYLIKVSNNEVFFLWFKHDSDMAFAGQ